MTEQEIQKLRAAGISESTINEMIAESQQQSSQTAPNTSNLPEIDVNTPSEVFMNAQKSGVRTQGEGQDLFSMQNAAELGAAVAPHAGTAALTVAGLKGLNALAANRKAKAAEAAKEALKQAARQSRVAPAAPAPAQPQILNQFGRPIAPAPAAPAVAPPTAPAAPAPSMLDRASAMVRQLAANKVLQNTARLGGAAAFAAQPSNLGPMVPSTGRMRGMEINPMTGRPWTQQEISVYESNPMQFDTQLMR
jgi:hypothetical protein